MNDGSIPELSLTVEPRVLPIFSHFLQGGFQLEAAVGCCVRKFLSDRCRLARDTIEDRISTVFLDGMPVDDLDSAFVKNNSTLALSGAMPGLVGAAMRTNSPLRNFRSSITRGSESEGGRQQHGRVRLKLFNTVMRDLAPSFLREGILLQPLIVKGFLAQQTEDGFREILLGGEPIDTKLFLDEEFLSEFPLVSLSVRTQE